MRIGTHVCVHWCEEDQPPNDVCLIIVITSLQQRLSRSTFLRFQFEFLLLLQSSLVLSSFSVVNDIFDVWWH